MTTSIPTIAVQEFFVELDDLMKSQSNEWQAKAADQKELWVSASDFDYYLKIRQQFDLPAGVRMDDGGLPILLFQGIRVKPLPVYSTNRPTP